MEKVKCTVSCSGIPRFSPRRLSQEEQGFWDEFTGLLCDDPQGCSYNDLIRVLRDMAHLYWKFRR